MFNYEKQSNKGGIYKITNRYNGKIYIGQCSRFKERWVRHEYEFLNGVHSNKQFQEDYNTYKKEPGNGFLSPFDCDVLFLTENKIQLNVQRNGLLSPFNYDVLFVTESKIQRNLLEKEQIALIPDEICYNKMPGNHTLFGIKKLEPLKKVSFEITENKYKELKIKAEETKLSVRKMITKIIYDYLGGEDNEEEFILRAMNLKKQINEIQTDEKFEDDLESVCKGADEIRKKYEANEAKRIQEELLAKKKADYEAWIQSEKDHKQRVEQARKANEKMIKERQGK